MCGSEPNVQVCPGGVSKRRGYGLSRAFVGCLDLANKRGANYNLFFEDDARLVDKTLCKPSNWPNLPLDTFVVLLGGHAWKGLGNVVNGYQKATASYGSYAFMVPKANVQDLSNFWFQDMNRDEKMLSPDVTFYKHANYRKKSVYRLSKLLAWHSKGWSNTWNRERDSIGKPVTNPSLVTETKPMNVPKKKNVYLIQGVAAGYARWALRVSNMKTSAILLYLSFDTNCDGCLFYPNSNYASGLNILVRKAMALTIPIKYIIYSDGDINMRCKIGGKIVQSETCWVYWNNYVIDNEKEWYINPKTWWDTEGDVSKYGTCLEPATTAILKEKVPLIYPIPEYNIEKSWWLNIHARWRVAEACFPNEFLSTDKFHIYNEKHMSYPRGKELTDILDIMKNDYKKLYPYTKGEKLKHNCKITTKQKLNCEKALLERYTLWYNDSKLATNYGM